MAWDFDCPICGTDKSVLPVGPRKSPVLIIGDAPGHQEVIEGKPFVGATGGVLRAELARQKIDLKQIRVTNLWLHEPNKKSECLEFGFKKALEEGNDRKVILLIGAETVKYFCNLSVEAYNGLLVPCQWFPHAKVIACMQPALVFHKSVGEIRFALGQFADVIRMEIPA